MITTIRTETKPKRDLRLMVSQWPGAKTEYIFHPVRKWRFDYAWPEILLAVEYEGVCKPKRGKSRHTTVGGFTEDATKYSAAAAMGWCVIRVTAPMVKDGRAFDMLNLAHEARRV